MVDIKPLSKFHKILVIILIIIGIIMVVSSAISFVYFIIDWADTCSKLEYFQVKETDDCIDFCKRLVSEEHVSGCIEWCSEDVVRCEHFLLK